MANFHDDIETIRMIVQQAPSRQAAEKRLHATEGFSIPRDVAMDVFEKAAAAKFQGMPALASSHFTAKLLQRYQVRAKKSESDA